MPTKRFFTEDVYVLRWQWRRVAEAIVAAKAQLKAAGLLCARNGRLVPGEGTQWHLGTYM